MPRFAVARSCGGSTSLNAPPTRTNALPRTFEIKTVANATNRNDMLWRIGIKLDELAQLRNKVIDGTHGTCPLAPHFFEDELARQDLTRMPHQKRKHIEL